MKLKNLAFSLVFALSVILSVHSQQTAVPVDVTDSLSLPRILEQVLSTQVRLSNAENQKVDLEASRLTQQDILNSLMGLPVTTP